MTRLIAVSQGHHEPQEEHVFAQLVPLLPPDAAMLELGAYWAYYSAWFLQGWPRRRAIALEPDPANLAVGEETMRLNKLKAEFIAGAVGAESATSWLFQTERSGAISIPRYSVPQILAAKGVDRLDILHCDTQGAEYEALTGSRALLLDGRIGWVSMSEIRFGHNGGAVRRGSAAD